MTAPGSGLEALRDIHLPEAVAFWPPAPGWWVALFVGLLLVAWLVVRSQARRPTANDVAEQLLDELESRFDRDCDRVVLAAELSQLLRRLALDRFAREDVASLHGEARGRALAAADPSCPIPTDLIERLERAIYVRDADDFGPREPTEWIDATRRFIRHTPRVDRARRRVTGRTT